VTLLLDTDVLIDFALDRKPHSDGASSLLDYLEAHPGLGFVAWHTLSNFYYLVAPDRGKTESKRFLLELCRFV